MAKGQKRGNREITKPKQDRAPARPEGAFSTPIKLAATSYVKRGNGKG